MDIGENGVTYEVVVNDGGTDGGTNATFTIEATLDDTWDGLTETVIDDAVQAFTDSVTTASSAFGTWTSKPSYKYKLDKTAL